MKRKCLKNSIFCKLGLFLLVFMISCATKTSQYYGHYPKKFYGIASWYGPNFHGKKTASGEIYNMFDFTAAHKYLPFNTLVRVRNLSNNKSVIVRINDRGPFVKNRIIDLSYAAAKKIDLIKTGTAFVEVEILFKKNYFIQVGCFLNPENAKRMLKKLKRFHPLLKRKGKLKCVIIGPYDLKNAKKILKKLSLCKNSIIIAVD